MFTRQHFRAIADTISKIEDMEARNAEAQRYVAIFRADNPRFKPELFLSACGVNNDAKRLTESVGL